jgi:hypothetical protein
MVEHVFLETQSQRPAESSYPGPTTCKISPVIVRGVTHGPQESRLLFTSYVGAVYVQKGLPVVVNWISRLVFPESEPLAAPGSSMGNTNAAAATASSPPPYSSSSTVPALPNAPPPPMPANPPTGLAPVNALSLFNQTCSQRGLVINWESESEGPPHQPRWAVKCLGEPSSLSAQSVAYVIES